MKPPSMIAITGASHGLGAALALEYAALGCTLALSARGLEDLQKVQRECTERGAQVSVQQVDITDRAQLEAWISEVERNIPIDLMIANAGIFSGVEAGGQMEPLDDVVRQIETNLVGTLSTAHLMIERMKKRQAGHLLMISSLAAVQPLADAPAYSAAKAGIRAYGEALREALLDDNITISVALPGHIDTRQTAVHVGATPGIISAQKAAKIIRKGLERGKSEIAFPFVPNWAVRTGRLLPWRLLALINRSQRFHVAKSSDQGSKGEF